MLFVLSVSCVSTIQVVGSFAEPWGLFLAEHFSVVLWFLLNAFSMG